MTVMINRHSARMLGTEGILDRLDPLNIILNGALPKSIKVIARDGWPEIGRMVGWIDLDKKFYVGHLLPAEVIHGTTIQHVQVQPYVDEDINSHFSSRVMVRKANEDQFLYWIEFEGEEHLTYYKENKRFSNIGEMVSFLRRSSVQPPAFNYEVIWLDNEGEYHLGKLISDDQIELKSYSRTEDVLRSISGFPFWISAPKRAIASTLGFEEEDYLNTPLFKVCKEIPNNQVPVGTILAQLSILDYGSAQIITAETGILHITLRRVPEGDNPEHFNSDKNNFFTIPRDCVQQIS
ncbi:hypothetical protein [Ewingella americana]|uniref:Uncharacterized protein n=1 Tax=Ewingella americana TaxID=41202 RepID=A0A502GDP4_9GAMM|nr:hypothetical protein [Ewingella americana]TPG59984.1 hypothetical protein EAH77_15570 [Ewingella americana]